MAAITILLACAACCALPIVAAIGLGGVATATIAWFADNKIVAVAGLMLTGLAMLLVWRAAAKRRATRTPST